MKRRAWVAAAVLLSVGALPAAENPPRVDYMLHCMGCHLEDGSGMTGKVPTLRGDSARILAAPGGREFLVRVPGVAQSMLEDHQLAAVLNWMLAEFNPQGLPAGFVPYTAQEVGELRQRKLVDVSGARARLIGPATN